VPHHFTFPEPEQYHFTFLEPEPHHFTFLESEPHHFTPFLGFTYSGALLCQIKKFIVHFDAASAPAVIS
jgi:hypothetical protein